MCGFGSDVPFPVRLLHICPRLLHRALHFCPAASAHLPGGFCTFARGPCTFARRLLHRLLHICPRLLHRALHFCPSALAHLPAGSCTGAAPEIPPRLNGIYRGRSCVEVRLEDIRATWGLRCERQHSTCALTV